MNKMINNETENLKTDNETKLKRGKPQTFEAKNFKYISYLIIY